MDNRNNTRGSSVEKANWMVYAGTKYLFIVNWGILKFLVDNYLLLFLSRLEFALNFNILKQETAKWNVMVLMKN